MEQLPPRLAWLGGAIAQATVLRSARLKTISELMRQLAHPVPEEVRADLVQHSCYLACLVNLEIATDWLDTLNTWEVRQNPQSGHWAIGARTACRPLGDSAQFIFVKQAHHDHEGHYYYHVVDELEADVVEGGKLTLLKLLGNPFAWLGAG
jgi:hypothetical protein